MEASEYIMLTAITPEVLAVRVNENIAQGYHVWGPPLIQNRELVQAMVLPKPKYQPQQDDGLRQARRYARRSDSRPGVDPRLQEDELPPRRRPAPRV